MPNTIDPQSRAAKGSDSYNGPVTLINSFVVPANPALYEVVAAADAEALEPASR